jgi:hypothetical protein
MIMLPVMGNTGVASLDALETKKYSPKWLEMNFLIILLITTTIKNAYQFSSFNYFLNICTVK